MNWELYFPQYAQLIGVGLLWITVHCAGMCGPIIAGLTLSNGHEGTSWQRFRRSALGVLSYQSGRGLMYMLLGTSAGFIGVALQNTIKTVSQTMGLVIAVALFFTGLSMIPVVRKQWRARFQSGFSSGQLTGHFLGRVMRMMNKVTPRKGLLRMFAFGFLLGLLPCMLMFWALGLAASTAHPVHGALLMLCLVIMTTPVLLIAGCSTQLARPALKRVGEYVMPFALMLSGVWLGLIGAAANDWIEHFHVPFTLWGEKLVIMFW